MIEDEKITLRQFVKAIKSYIWWAFLTSIFLFLVNKHIIRQYFEVDDFSKILRTIVYSLPNFIEAIYGTIVLLMIIYALKGNRQKNQPITMGRKTIVVLIPFVGLYTICQELNWIKLSTNSTYDLNDIIASLLGIVVINAMLLHFGFLKESGELSHSELDRSP